MTGEHSISRWLTPLQQGDEAAVQALFERYFQALVRMSRRRLADANRRVADEEDIALSAFESFCRGAAEGRFPKLADRDDLWKLLVVISARKSADYKKRGMRQKRGDGLVRGESVFLDHDGSVDAGIAAVVGEAPTPAFAAEVAEECERLLVLLEPELREIAQLKLEGYTNAEIATRQGRNERAIERKLHRIRLLWSEGDSSVT